MGYDNLKLAGSHNRAGFVTTVDQFDADKSELGMFYVLGQRWTNGTPHTGTLAETELDYALTIPGGLLGANGSMRITAYFGATNNANSKIVQAKLGGWGISGATQNMAGTAAYGFARHFVNRGAENQNRWYGTSGLAAPYGALAGVDMNIDTSVDQTLTFTATLSNPADQVWLSGVLVEVFPT